MQPSSEDRFDDDAIKLLSRTPTFLLPQTILVWSRSTDPVYCDTIVAAFPGKSVTFVRAKRYESKLQYSIVAKVETIEEPFDVVYVDRVITNKNITALSSLLQRSPVSTYVIRTKALTNVIFDTLRSNGFDTQFFDKESQTAAIFDDTAYDTLIAKMKS